MTFDFRLNNEFRIHAIHRDITAGDGKIEHIRCPGTQHTELYLRSFLAAQGAHHLFVIDLLAYKQTVINCNQFIPCQHTDTFTRTACDDGNDADRVLLDRELDTDAGERTG